MSHAKGLIYPDNAQIALLERASDAERAAVLDALHERQALPALSFHHVQETAQLESEESVTRRLEAVGLFPAIGFSFTGSSSAMDLEIRAALLDVLGVDTGGRDLRRLLFPPTSPGDFASYVWDARPKLLQETRPLMEMAAEAEALFQPLRGLQGQRKKFKNVPADEDKLAAAHPAWLKAREMMKRFVGAATEADEAPASSTRELAENDLGLRGIPAAARALDEDLGQFAVFFQKARALAAEVGSQFSLSRDDALALVEQLDPYGCPGFALQTAVRRARQRSGSDATPSAIVDEWQLAYAPYVDLMFVDKRTLTFLEQEADRLPDLMPVDVLGSLRRNRDLAGTVAAIRGD